MKILLVCAGGMSTSILMNKMKKALTSEQADWDIIARPIETIRDYIEEYDVILLGPQVKHKLEKIKDEFKEFGKPIDMISPIDYGMGNGTAVLKQAIELVQEKESI